MSNNITLVKSCGYDINYIISENIYKPKKK